MRPVLDVGEIYVERCVGGCGGVSMDVDCVGCYGEMPG